MKIAVIIPAAGAGTRFGDAPETGAATSGGPSKIEIDLAGRPVFMRSIELFLNRHEVGQIILAVNPDAIDDFKFRWGDKLGFHGVKVIPGGTVERWETVSKALDTIDDNCTHVAVHDAARPLATSKLIDDLLDAAAKHNAVVPGLPVSATLRRVANDESGAAEEDPLDAILGSAGKPSYSVRRAVEPVDRTNVVEIQTPQFFEIDLLRRAYAQIGSIDTSSITDDAGLVESLGESVFVIDGESTNLKITHPADAELAQALIEKRESKSKVDLAKKRLFADDDDF